MEKALEIGRTSATGSLRLFIGKVMSTVILAVGTIVLGLLISESDYGLYAIALIPGTTMLLFQDWGVGSAMIRYCAHYRAVDKEGQLRKIIVSGLTFEAATGLALTMLSFSMANFIGSTVFGKPESAFLMTLVSISIFATSLFAASQSIFTGFERMGLSSLTMTCQAVAQCVLAPLLVYLGYGAIGATLGYTAGSVVAGISALAILYFAIFRKLRPDNQDKTGKLQILRPLLHYGIPLAIASILSGILTQFYSFMIASYSDAAIIGNYRVATNFAILLTFFTIPITTVLFPAFSKLNPGNEKQLLKTVFASSVKYTALFLVPATMCMMVLSKPMISTLYAGKWPFASFFLTLFIISNLFAIVGSLSFVSLLQAQGETKMLMMLNILNLPIGIPLALLLIPMLGIPGAILVSIIAGLPSMFIGLYWIWKRYGTKADLQTSARIFLASALAAAVTYLFLNVFVAVEWIRLVTGVTIFLLLYFIIAPFIGAINKTDTHNLRVMFCRLGVLSRLLEIPLVFLEQVLRMRDVFRRVRKQ